MKKVLIISPHSDDALFSCSHVLFLPEYEEVQVLTVENDAKRIAEDEKLFKFLNIPFHHLNVEFKDESFYQFHKDYKDLIGYEALEYLEAYFGKDKCNEIRSALVNWVSNFLKEHPDYTVLSPWGIGHPFHYFVKHCLESFISKLWYYREFPHSYKRRSQAQVVREQKNYFLSRSVPTEDFHEVKFKLASKFYRSQSGLLFYEQGYIKKQLPEEIYELDELPF